MGFFHHVSLFRSHAQRSFGLCVPVMTPSDSDRRRYSGIIQRKIRLLSAHGLASKVPHTHRYTLARKGRIAVTALLTAQNADTASLIKLTSYRQP